MNTERILVVGTTADYIDHMLSHNPEGFVFVTDILERAGWPGENPDDESEVLCNLADIKKTLSLVEDHVVKFGLSIIGVSCFDCESLRLASLCADIFELDFPSEASVLNCRSKYTSQLNWAENGVECPKSAEIADEEDLLAAMDTIGFPMVIKPLTGSGSELVFKLNNREEALDRFSFIEDRLARHHNTRMYSIRTATAICSVEEFISGQEYSCDYLVEDGKVTIIRIAEKIGTKNLPFATTLGYVVPARLPEGITREMLQSVLEKAAEAVGLTRTVCMTDFFIRNGRIVLIEMTPRVGGDCLPDVIRASGGFDTILEATRFSAKQQVNIPAPSAWKTVIGVRIIADRSGVLDSIDLSKLDGDKRLLSTHINREEGHIITAPPEDYDSRILGHVVIQPDDRAELHDQCREVAEKIRIIYG